MECFRIARAPYADMLSGEGARLYGGRWNSRGTSLIYTAATSSLAMLELLVHMNVGHVGASYYLIQISVPDSLLAPALPVKKLGLGWNANPPQHRTQSIGDDFVKKAKYAVLPVPSAVNPREKNYLINDQHPDFKQIKIIGKQVIDFDRRLIP